VRIDDSMYVPAGTRSVDLDIAQTGPQRLERLLDLAGDLERVGAGSLLDHEHQARPSSTTASPMRGWWSSTTSATSPRRSGTPATSSTGTWARSSAVVIGRTCWMGQALGGGFDEPAGAGVDASMKVSGETHSALPVVARSGERHAGGGQPLRVDLHLELPLALAPDRHVRDPGQALEARLDLPAASTDMSIREMSGEEEPDHMTGWSTRPGRS